MEIDTAISQMDGPAEEGSVSRRTKQEPIRADHGLRAQTTQHTKRSKAKQSRAMAGVAIVDMHA